MEKDMGKGNRTRQEAMKAANSGGTKTWVKIVGWTVGIAFLVLLAFSLLHTTGLLQRTLSAAKVGDMSVSALDYNILYKYSRTSWLNASDNGYGVPNYYMLQMSGYPIDDTLDALPNEEGGTWRDTFNAIAQETMHSLLSLYQEGKSKGFTLPADADDLGQAQIDGLAEAAASYGVTVEAYIASYYRNNTKESDLRRVFDIITYASNYGTSIQDGYGIGDAEVETYYQANRDSFDQADYHSQVFPYTNYTYTAPAEGESVAEGQPASEAEATTMTEASKNEAKALADAFMARLNAGEDFDALSKEIFDAEQAEAPVVEGEEPDAFTTTLIEKAGITGTTALITWLKDTVRVQGDTEVIDTGSGYSVARFMNRYIDPTRTATVRHILFPITSEMSDEPTETEIAIRDTELDMLRGTAQAVLTEWMVGAATEEQFAELAKTHSRDGNAEQGGIYEHFREGQMVQSFNDWCFDESRQRGDTGLVETEYGIHLMYFVSFDQPGYYYTIQNTIMVERFTADLDALVEKYTMTTHKMGMNLSF